MQKQKKMKIKRRRKMDNMEKSHKANALWFKGDLISRLNSLPLTEEVVFSEPWHYGGMAILADRQRQVIEMMKKKFKKELKPDTTDRRKVNEK